MNKKYSGSQEPFSLASTGNKMKVKFTSDGSINKKGFQATVAFGKLHVMIYVPHSL